MDDVARDLWARLPGDDSDGDDSGGGSDAEGEGRGQGDGAALAALALRRLALVTEALGDRWVQREYVYFEPVSEEEAKVPPVQSRLSPWAETDQLLFRIKHIDAPIVIGTMTANGFKETQGTNFVLQWSGPKMSDDMYRYLQPHQRVNHFPGSTELTRKDRMAVHLQEMATKFGKNAFNFIPETYVLPKQLHEFLAIYQRHPNYMWIVKPNASSRGRGIFVLRDVKDLSLDEVTVVCRYIHNPLLIHGLKFDLRVYVIVTSFSPLRAYVYREGLTRFASLQYSTKPEHMSDSYRHLTNYSINKYAPNFVENKKASQDNVGHKWSFSALNKHLKHVGVDTSIMWSRINDLCVKTLLSVEPTISRKMRDLYMKHQTCFELYGFDVLVDAKLKPWLLEVNLSPSMRADSPLDWQIKSSLLADAFNLVGVSRLDRQAAFEQRTYSQPPYMLPVQSRYANSFSRSASLDSLRTVRKTWSGPGPGVGTGYPLPTVGFSDLCKSYDTSEGWAQERIALEDLNEAQLQMLAQSLEEFGRRGNFHCLYPTRKATRRYASITEALASEAARQSLGAVVCRLAPSQLLSSVLFGPRPAPVPRRPPSRSRPPSAARRAEAAASVLAAASAAGVPDAGEASPDALRSSRPPLLPRSDSMPSPMSATGAPRPPPPSSASEMAAAAATGAFFCKPVPRLRHKVTLKPKLPPVLPIERAQSTPARLGGHRVDAATAATRAAAAAAAAGLSMSVGGSRPSTAGSGSANSSPRVSRSPPASPMPTGEEEEEEEEADLAASEALETRSPAAPPKADPPVYVFTSAHLKDFRNIEF